MQFEKDGYKITFVDGLGNHYGGLYVAEKDGGYFWYIMDHDGGFNWEEKISKSLYDAILIHQENPLSPS